VRDVQFRNMRLHECIEADKFQDDKSGGVTIAVQLSNIEEIPSAFDISIFATSNEVQLDIP